MTIESQNGSTRYRVDPHDARAIQVQRAPGDRWRELCRRKTADDAREAVMLLGRGVRTEASE